MEKEMICISCPIGCHLRVSYNEKDVITPESILVENNKCPRGVIYGREEVLSPKRVVTATCAVNSVLMDRVPVKSTAALRKEVINGLLDELYRIRLNTPVKMGDVVIKDYKKSGIDIVTTRSLSS